ncbi:hypothetical protein J1605_008436 [Eschrichtius robustus]|uniref:Uncharacterized protein n=1 Tax=Eschrichtius robustus TaxID=9764 RepID=A0AB34H076_ESCRO|nr:hypothetical protein J1605_008436 [Eschrichtius robustus]
MAAPEHSGSGRQLLASALSGVPSALCSVFLSVWEQKQEEEEKEEEEEEEEDVWSGLGGGAAAAATAGKGEAGETETWKPQSTRDPARQAPFQLHGQSVETADVPSVRHLLLPPVSSSEALAWAKPGGARGGGCPRSGVRGSGYRKPRGERLDRKEPPAPSWPGKRGGSRAERRPSPSLGCSAADAWGPRQDPLVARLFEPFSWASPGEQ